MRRNRLHRRLPRTGYSLLELVAAVALIAGTLVPAMELMRDGLQMSIEPDRRVLLAGYGVSEMERLLGATAAVWTTGATTGDFAADGNADVRFDAVVSDDPLSCVILGALMDLQVTTYWDEDGDDTLDAGEPRCDFRTKLGRFATYEAIAL